MEFAKGFVKKEADWAITRFVFPEVDIEQIQQQHRCLNTGAKGTYSLWTEEENAQFEQIMKSIEDSGISPTMKYWE